MSDTVPRLISNRFSVPFFCPENDHFPDWRLLFSCTEKVDFLFIIRILAVKIDTSPNESDN